MNDQSDMPVDVPAIGMSFRHPLDDQGREIVFQAHIPATCDDATLNALLDKLSRAGERQKARVHIPTLQGIVDDKKQVLSNKINAKLLAEAELDVQDKLWKKEAEGAGRRNWMPTPKQKTDRIQVQAQIAQHERDIGELQKLIKSYEGQIAMYRDRIPEEA